MYSELMLREHGFDDDARFRVILHTDAIWRACRIILDVRMHRGELSVDEATDFLVEQTGFQRSNARAEVGWYTYRPDLPAVVPARSDAPALAARRRAARGSATRSRSRASTTRCSATARCRSASTAGCSPARADDRCWSSRPIDLEAGRSTDRLLARRRGRRRRPDRPPGPDRRDVRGDGRAAPPPRRLRRRPRRRAGRARRDRRPSRRASRSRSRWRAASSPPTRIRLVFAAGATRVVLTTGIADRPDDLRACLEVAGDWLAVGLDPRPERLAAFPWRRSVPPTLDGLVGELVGAGVGALRPVPRRRRAGPRAGRVRSFGRTMPRSSWLAASETSTASAACAIPASPASSSGRPSSPGPSTTPPRWRPPHDPSLLPTRHRRRLAPRPPRRRACSLPGRSGGGMLRLAGGGPRASRHRRPQRGLDRRVGGRRPSCPTSQPERAPRRRDADRHHRDRQGRHHDGRSRRTCRRSRSATSSPSPSAATTTGSSSTASCPGSSSRAATPPTGDRRDRWPRLHDQGRAGHDRPTTGARSRWPGHRGPELRRVAVLHRDSTTAAAALWPPTTPTRSSARSPPGMEVVDAIAAGRRQATGTWPPIPSSMNKVTVTNP